MRNLWDEALAENLVNDLDQRVYSSRLLGANADLVLHGGGNTSVKSKRENIFGSEQDVLYVKGSGWDLATIEAQGFSPVLMRPLLDLSALDTLSDLDMARELRLATLDPAAPNPSVEAILHAILPYKFVDHTHADSIIALTNTPSGEQHIHEAFGDDVVIIPYVMPGFILAKAVAERLPELTATTKGIILMNHGIFTVGASAREAYDSMIALVSRAEAYIKQHGAWLSEAASGEVALRPTSSWRSLASLRLDVSRVVRSPMILHTCDDAESWRFSRDSDLRELALQGPATPDHVLRTKSVPLVGDDVTTYAQSYSNYFETGKKLSRGNLKMLDPAPRVVISPEFGVITVGSSAKDAGIVADIYRHTIKIIRQATLLERWQALPPEKLFEVEYWDLEQAKVAGSREKNSLQGQVVLLFYPPSACQEAYVENFAKRGAAIITVTKEAETNKATQNDSHKVFVTNEHHTSDALMSKLVRAYGGIDHIIYFPAAIVDKENKPTQLHSDLLETLKMSPGSPSLTVFHDSSGSDDTNVMTLIGEQQPGKTPRVHIFEITSSADVSQYCEPIEAIIALTDVAFEQISEFRGR